MLAGCVLVVMKDRTSGKLIFSHKHAPSQEISGRWEPNEHRTCEGCEYWASCWGGRVEGNAREMHHRVSYDWGLLVGRSPNPIPEYYTESYLLHDVEEPRSSG